MRYNNYHKHSHESNPRTLDCVSKPIDYINRALELGHTTYFTTEHGWSGIFLQSYDLCKKNNLLMVYGVEAYFVEDRFKQDRSNAHIVIVAKNINGFKQLNRIMSESNKTGFYYKNRIDYELLFSLDPKNFIVTSACVAGPSIDQILRIKSHFDNNFYLEMQNHNAPIQIDRNQLMLKAARDYQINIIHGNDSHYVYPEQLRDRDMFLKGKGLHYHDESIFILDYPNYDTIIERYVEQGVLSKKEIYHSLENTLIFDDCEDLGFNKEVKMPKHPNVIDANAELKQIIDENSKDVIHLNRYKHRIEKEYNIIKDTNMSNYFVLNYYIIKRAVEKYGAILTRTGRGSAASFYVNKLLGFTNIDAVEAEITLYMTRFMSIARIMETKSLPDIDFNFASVEPVIQASKDILGEDGIYYMIALGTMQASSAFRNLCRAYNLNVNEYNEIAKNLEAYEDHEYWGQYIAESKKYIGTIESVSPSPCSFILLDKPISEEIGLIKIGSQICACIDGYTSDVFKYLKNDYLTVKIWKIVSDTFKLINKPIPGIMDLKTYLDDKVWALYEKGITATLNQVDTHSSTKLIMQYKPKTVAELSAFVAAIRPGFASLLNKFLSRQKHTTGVDSLDELLSDSYCYMLYQESIMKFLVWCSLEEDQTYDIIKKISKKKFKEDEIATLKQTLLSGFINNTSNPDKFDEVWQVIEDAASYSFNASHSLSVAWDSLYGAYLKANFPLEYYTVVLNIYISDTDKTTKIISELPYFKIAIKPVKFRYSHDDYMFERETNSIYKGLVSIKTIGAKANLANQILQFKDIKYSNFVELLIDIATKTSIGMSNIRKLIELNFFSEFGDINYLFKVIDIFESLYGRMQISKKNLDVLNIQPELIEKYSAKATDKTYMQIDIKGLILALIKDIKYVKCNYIDILKSEFKYFNSLHSRFNVNKSCYMVIDINTDYTPRIKAYNILTGEIVQYKIYKNNFYRKQDIEHPQDEPLINLLDVIFVKKTYIKNRQKLVNDEWVSMEETEIVLDKFVVKR